MVPAQLTPGPSPQTWWLSWDGGRTYAVVPCRVYNHFRKLLGQEPVKVGAVDNFEGTYLDYCEPTPVRGHTYGKGK